MISKKLLLTLILILLFLGMIYAPQKQFISKTYATTLSPYNEDPYGTSYLAEKIDSWGFNLVYEGATALEKYGEKSVYILIGPDSPLSLDEIKKIHSYIKRGGGILIADELGTVNSLINYLFNSRIDDTYLNKTYNLKLDILVQHITVFAHPELGIDINIEDKESIINFLIAKYTYKYSASLPSYIEEKGILKVNGIGSYIDTNNFTAPLSTTTKIYSGYYDGDYPYKGRAYVVADTSLFINDVTQKYEWVLNYIKRILLWLGQSETPSDITVIFDDTHIRPLIFKVPIPHMGKLILGALGYTLENVFYGYNTYLRTSPLWMTTIILLFLIMSFYTTYRKKIRIESGKDSWIEPILEKKYVAESEFLINLKRGFKDNTFYKSMMIDLYDTYNYILENLVNTSIESIIKGDLRQEIVEKYDKRTRDKIVRAAKRLYDIKTKIEKKRLLPIIISWKREVNRLIKDIDYICSGIGIEFISEGERKIEYLIK